MDVIEEWENLKRKIARLKEEESRRQGSLESLEDRLGEEYGVSVKQAEKEVPTLVKKVERLKLELKEKIEKIKQEIQEQV